MNRDHAAEAAALPIHRFDEIMHDYLWRTFKPHMQGVSALELGCFRGHFTKMIREEYPDVTVVDASADCLGAAFSIGKQIACVHSTFEEAVLEQRYDAIFLLHTLEHLDDPVRVLKRCLYEWLADDGVLFVAVPNANAASRQIAVKMGLVEAPEAVTPAEAAHGHKRTYTQETLLKTLVLAGLRVEEMGGVMFKALANWQMDRALAKGVIDKTYLDGCFEFGKRAPEMCASIYAVCRKQA